MVEFKEKADRIIKERYGIEVEHYCAMKDDQKLTYERMFYTIPTRRKPERERGRELWRQQGTILGFPMRRMPWCNSRLKRNALRFPSYNRVMVQETQVRDVSTDSRCAWEIGVHPSKHLFSNKRLARGAKINTVQYLGIAVDEPERVERHTKDGFKLPLVAAGWDEAYCRKWCEENDLLSPIYTTATRGGCWFCHNQSVDQLRLLRKNYPDLWQLLLKWDKDSPVTFKSDGHTVHDFDKRFSMEDAGKAPNNRTFRWKLLDDVG